MISFGLQARSASPPDSKCSIAGPAYCNASFARHLKIISWNCFVLTASAPQTLEREKMIEGVELRSLVRVRRLPVRLSPNTPGMIS